MNQLTSGGEYGIQQHESIYLQTARPKRTSFGKVLFIVAGVAMFVFWGLYLINTPEQDGAIVESIPTVQAFQAAIDAMQLDSVENEQLLQQMAINGHVNAANQLALQATAVFVPVQAQQTLTADSIVLASANTANSIDIAKADVSNVIDLEMARNQMEIDKANANGELALMLSASTALFLASVGGVACVFYLLRQPKEERAEPVMIEVESNGNDPAMDELFKMIKELADKQAISEVISRNYDNSTINQCVLPHLEALERAGLTPEQVGWLPLKMADLRENDNRVPEWAVSAMRRLKGDGMNAAVIAPIFGLNGTKNKYYQEVMK